MVESVKSFFREKVGERAERISMLDKAVQSFSTVEKFPDQVRRGLIRWTGVFMEPVKVSRSTSEDEVEIFGSAIEYEVAATFSRLEQAQPDIGDEKEIRLWLICIAHEIENLSQSLDIDFYTAKGVNPTNATLRMASKYCPTLRSEWKRATKMVQLMDLGGPASLLDMGRLLQSSWDNIPKHDIQHIFEWREDQSPDFDKMVKSQNTQVSMAIVCILLKYGWSSSDLKLSDTKVMLILKRYLPKQAPANSLGTHYGQDWTGRVSIVTKDPVIPKNIANAARKSLDEEFGRIEDKRGLAKTLSSVALEWTPETITVREAFEAALEARGTADLVPIQRLGGNPSGRLTWVCPIVYLDIQPQPLAYSSSALGYGILGLIALGTLVLPEIRNCGTITIQSGSVAYFRASSPIEFRASKGRGIMFYIREI